MKVDITAVVNLHREGAWAHKALRSALVALEHSDLSWELIAVLDRADEATIAAAEMFDDETIRTYFTEHGDLGLARNEAVKAAKGRYVGFLDGDDIWGRSWPGAAVGELDVLRETFPDRDFVAHPLCHVDFGEALFWWTQPDQRSAEWDPSVFWHNNCWSSCAIAPASVLKVHPYTPRTAGHGYEDWEWNARTVAAGVVHVAVPRTVTFIRKRSDGLGADVARKRQIPHHSLYFERDPESLRPTGAGKPGDASIGQWLFDDWRAAHRVEPELWPDARQAQQLKRYRVGGSAVHEAALAVASRVRTAPTHLILAPHLVVGGADRRVVEYASAVARRGGRPLVLLTDRPSPGEPWRDRVPEGVQVLNAVGALNDAAGPERSEGGPALVLARLVDMWNPIVHVVNSSRGYTALARHGATIAESARGVYASIYGAEEDGDKLGGMAFNGFFFPASKWISRVITDNGRIADMLAEIHGWGNVRSSIVRTPIDRPSEAELTALHKERGAGNPHGLVRVLWASRMEKCKRLDRLHAIAKEAFRRKAQIVFAVAGAPCDAHSREWASRLAELPNVKASLGTFAGWSALAAGRHDVYLCTSESEGMPNTLLEAAARGLRVVSTAAGDIGRMPVRIVEQPDVDRPEAWIEALLERGRAQEGMDYVARLHTPAAFERGLAGAGYFDGLPDAPVQSFNDPGPEAR